LPKQSDQRNLPYSAQQMFELAADVAKYPEFLPWCSGMRIRSRTQVEDTEVMLADLIISFKVFREKFGSKVILKPNEMRIDTSYLDGPFKYLESYWQFTPVSDSECTVEFYVDFEFKSRVLQAAIGVVFDQAMQKIIRAFEERAADLYR